jgi:hypothetical protein
VYRTAWLAVINWCFGCKRTRCKVPNSTYLLLLLLLLLPPRRLLAPAPLRPDGAKRPDSAGGLAHIQF